MATNHFNTRSTAIRIGLDLLDGHPTVLNALTANPELAADILLAHQYRNGDQAQALQLAKIYDQAMRPTMGGK
jgi:hypothetical protein